MANNTIDLGVEIVLTDKISPELAAIGNRIKVLERTLINAFHPESLVREQEELAKLKQKWVDYGGELVKIPPAVKKIGDALDEHITKQSTNSFRALGSLDRATREFATGSLQQGANGLIFFGNSMARIAEKEGGVLNALSNIGGALNGPAGIVLGFSLLVGILENNKDAIANFFSRGLPDLKKLRDELKKLNEDIYKIAGEGQAKQITGTILINEITNDKNSIGIRKNALKELQGLYSDNKALNDLDLKNVTTYSKDYLTTLNNQASVQFEYLGKEKNYIEGLARNQDKLKDIEDKRKDALKAVTGPKEAILNIGNANVKSTISVDQQNKDINAFYDNAEKQVKINSKSYEDAIKRNTPLAILYSVNGEKEDKDAGKRNAALRKKQEEEIAILEDAIKKQNKIFDEELKLSEKIQKLNKKSNIFSWRDTIEGQRNPDLDVPDWMIRQMGGKNIATEKIDYKKIEPVAIKDYERDKKEEADALKTRTELYKKFANTISSEMTNAFRSMVDGISSGKDALDQLGQSFLKLAEDIAFTIIKEELFAGISAALGLNKGQTGTGADTTTSGSGVDVGSIASFIAKIAPLFLADGGIVSSPTLAMVGEGSQPEAVMPLSKLSSMMNSTFSAGAMSGGGIGGSGQFTLKGNDLVLALQRSNYSLNLRRGA